MNRDRDIQVAQAVNLAVETLNAKLINGEKSSKDISNVDIKNLAHKYYNLLKELKEEIALEEQEELENKRLRILKIKEEKDALSNGDIEEIIGE